MIERRRRPFGRDFLLDTAASYLEITVSFERIFSRNNAIKDTRFPVRDWHALVAPKLRSRSHDAMIRVYDEASDVIQTHEHTGDFKAW